MSMGYTRRSFLRLSAITAGVMLAGGGTLPFRVAYADEGSVNPYVQIAYKMAKRGEDYLEFADDHKFTAVTSLSTWFKSYSEGPEDKAFWEDMGMPYLFTKITISSLFRTCARYELIDDDPLVAIDKELIGQDFVPDSTGMLYVDDWYKTSPRLPVLIRWSEMGTDTFEAPLAYLGSSNADVAEARDITFGTRVGEGDVDWEGDSEELQELLDGYAAGIIPKSEGSCTLYFGDFTSFKCTRAMQFTGVGGINGACEGEYTVYPITVTVGDADAPSAARWEDSSSFIECHSLLNGTTKTLYVRPSWVKNSELVTLSSVQHCVSDTVFAEYRTEDVLETNALAIDVHLNINPKNQVATAEEWVENALLTHVHVFKASSLDLDDLASFDAAEVIDYAAGNLHLAQAELIETDASPYRYAFRSVFSIDMDSLDPGEDYVALLEAFPANVYYVTMVTTEPNEYQILPDVTTGDSDVLIRFSTADALEEWNAGGDPADDPDDEGPADDPDDKDPADNPDDKDPDGDSEDKNSDGELNTEGSSENPGGGSGGAGASEQSGSTTVLPKTGDSTATVAAVAAVAAAAGLGVVAKAAHETVQAEQ